MEVFDSKNKSYAFTIKALGSKDITPNGYKSIIEHWTKFGLIDCHFFEQDSCGKWHVHGIILLRKGFLRSKLKMFGMNMKLDELYNRQGWERYINKDQKRYLFDPIYEPKFDSLQTLMGTECSINN